MEHTCVPSGYTGVYHVGTQVCTTTLHRCEGISVAAGGRLRGLEPAVFAEDQHRERLAGRGVDDLLVLRVFVVDLLALEGEFITTLATPSGRLRRWIFPRRRRERDKTTHSSGHC